MAILVNEQLLKKFVPLGALNTNNFQKLATKTYLEKVAMGKSIFKEGDNDNQSVYVVSGQVNLVSSAGEPSTIIAGSETARHPIANQQPRRYNAIATSDSEIIRIDRDLLDMLLTWDQVSGIEVGEIQGDKENAEGDKDDSVDWMTRMLQSKAFLQIPPANIQALFMRVQEVQVKAGDVIIRQGDDGDYYYIIKHGQCKVTRHPKVGPEQELARLNDGDFFGEEALLSEAKRNANITMLTDGSLMRLSKADFNELLREPMLNWVTNEEADALVRNEGAVWIDVRLESEYRNSNIEGSINIPLFTLRLKAAELDPSKQYILYCNSGRQSSACAYLLSERGLKVYCLKGGFVERSS